LADAEREAEDDMADFLESIEQGTVKSCKLPPALLLG
jgi:hypothetical protein